MSEEQMGLIVPEKLLTTLPLAIGIILLFLVGVGIDIWMFARIPILRTTLAARAPALHRTPWTWREGLILGLVAMLLNQIAFLVIRTVERLSGSTAASLPMALLFQTAWVPLCILVLVRAMLRWHGTTWKAAFGLDACRPAQEIGRALQLLLAMLPPLALTAVLAQLVFTRLHIPFERQFVVDILIDPSQPTWLRAYLCVAAVSVAPVVEEITFRGILLPALARGGRWGLATGVAALLFATAHFNLASLLPLFVLALGLSLAYIASVSLCLPILIHALFNAFSIGVLLVAARFL